jgi:hypothetical protein
MTLAHDIAGANAGLRTPGEKWQNNRLTQNPLNAYSSAYPVLVCIHIAGICCGVGTAALVNFSLLGVGLTRNSAARLWREATPWTLGGLFLAICSGLLLFSIDPKTYLENSVFRFKMAALAAAIVFYFTMARKAAASDSRRGGACTIACISLALWALVPFGGIFIEFAGSMSRYAYPVLLSLHIVALICFLGMVVVTNLRFLGIGMRSYSAEEVVNGLRVPKCVTFAVAAICGALMLGATNWAYAYDRRFWSKMILLVTIAGGTWFFRRAAGKSPRAAQVRAACLLLLWTLTVAAARGPATVKDIMHSAIDPSGDFLFQSVQTIADEHGVRQKAPHTDEEWYNVRQRVMILLQAPDLLQGRMAARPRDRSKNPEVENEPEEVQKLIDSDGADFIRRSHRLRDAASVALKAVQTKDKDALGLALDRIDKACESCHLHYWYPRDKRAQEAAKEDGIIE